MMGINNINYLQKYSHPRLKDAFLFGLILVMGSCQTCIGTGGTASPSMIEVMPLPTVTLQAENSSSNSILVTTPDRGLYRVRVRVVLSEGATFAPSDAGVSIIYVDPWTDREESETPTLESNSTTDYYFDLPGSDGLEICQAMFYRWTAVYDIIEGERGVYIGEARYEMPTSESTSPNTITTALCQEPTSPWGNF